jgi:hypothetical protein
MRRAISAIVLLLATDEARAACHRYSVWKYPRPQTCRVTALAPRSALPVSRARINVSLNRPAPHRIVTPAPAILLLPSLTNIDWGQLPDDELRGRLLLRVILQGKESK